MNTRQMSTDSFLLKIVKKVLNEKSDLTKLVFVLPNQRAGVHLRKHIKSHLQKSSFFPEIITFDNFAEQLSGIPKTATVELLFDFYEVYKRETPKEKTENFELFANWAPTVLNDFNEIDANLVNPKHIFSSLKEINKLQNWEPNTELTHSYLIFFQNLEKYYYAFSKKLIEEGKTYQGLIFREAVDAIHSFVENTDKQFIFIGFNHLKSSESQILQELLEADKAQVFWDIPKYLLEENHPASRFINSYKTNWDYYTKNDFNWLTDDDYKFDNIEIIGVPKNVGMLKYAGEIIENKKDIDQTALILADQNILPVALNSLPTRVEEVNITMGFPLKNFPFSDFVRSFFELHNHSNSKENKSFYYKKVLNILQHPFVQVYFTNLDALTDDLIAKNKVYISIFDIEKLGELHEVSSLDVLLDLLKPDTNNSVNEILISLKTFIKFLKNNQQGFEKEVLYRHYQLNQQLEVLTNKYDHITTIESLHKIYLHILQLENVNFIGEPLQGLQLMGFLETQALNFKHIIITSVNEGILPKGKRVSSFIPFDVRKYYNLLTYQEKDAIESYHFFRLLHASNKVSLLYNSDTDTFGGGEKSQFLMQLLWKNPKIKHKYINSKLTSNTKDLLSIHKAPTIINKLKEIAKKGFSPSVLGTYLYDQVEFYQQRVLGVYELNEIEETVADNTLGTVIHETLYNLYKPYISKILDVQKLKAIVPKIKQQAKDCFIKEYKNGQIDHGKNKLIYEVVINYVKRFINKEIQQVKSGKSIRIIALEEKLSSDINFSNFHFSIRIKGIVDRIDEIDGVIRIIDYKSGRVESNQLRLDGFDKMITDYKYAKALQVLLYTYLYTQQTNFDFTKEIQAGIISFKNLNQGFMPVNFAPVMQYDYIITSDYLKEFMKGIEMLLLEIFDEDIPFMEKEDK